LPDGNPKKGLSLLSNPELDDEKKMAYLQVLTSTTPPAIVWSPDGDRAVFLAAIDHPTLELYLFDSSDLSVTRLSEVSRDIYQPTWSPDGQWVVYDETDGLNMIGLWAVTAVKAVRANASQTVTLYEPQSYAEPRLGWSSQDTFVVHSVRERGPVDLREISLDGGEASLIFAGACNNPVFNPDSGLAAFLTTDDFNDPAAQPAGIYTASKTQPAKLLAAGNWNALAWVSDPGLFLAVKDPSGAVSISPSGQQVSFDNESSLPKISPRGDVLAFSGGKDSTNPGLRLYSFQGELETEVSSDPVDNLLWLPDGSLVYSQGGGLYQLAMPTGQPAKLAENAVLLGWLSVGTAP
jgi:Tol biopolymer transport system component